MEFDNTWITLSYASLLYYRMVCDLAKMLKYIAAYLFFDMTKISSSAISLEQAMQLWKHSKTHL